MRTKKLPHSLSEIRDMTTSCKESLEIKPQFLSSNDAQLVKATQIFERLYIDFKGPQPSVSNNRYKSWLHTHGVSTSRTTSYNPRDNGQCERYNGVI